MIAALVGLGLVLAGCGDGAPGEEGDDIHLMYVNWVEGVALAHVMEAVLEDSLGMNVERTEVAGGGTAFASVATGNADVLVEVWLPTYHAGPWEEYQDELQIVSTWYENADQGMAVPDYVEFEHVSEIEEYREELDGEIMGIESGAPAHDYIRQVLAENDVEGFSVTESSEPAMISALQSAILNEEPVIITAWRPHWKWGRYDMRYLEGAQTGETDIYGDPENIHMVARQDFEEQYPERVVQFIDNIYTDNEALNSLMQPFRPDADVDDQMEAAREWIQEHSELVSSWIPPEDVQAPHADASGAAPNAE